MFPWNVQILSSDKTEGVSPLPRLANPGAMQLLPLVREHFAHIDITDSGEGLHNLANMLGVHGHYRATPALTRNLGIHGFIVSTALYIIPL